MQVKKFEARSMKEALELVKSQLGPDAIILSVRDNNKSYGLVGEGSVEITAAVSDETLQKKKFVESKLREQDKQKFLQGSARQQKELITKMVSTHLDKNRKPDVTQRRYVEIEDDLEMSPNARIAEERIKGAAQRALAAFNQQSDADRKKEIEAEMARRQKAAGSIQTSAQMAAKATAAPTAAPSVAAATPKVDTAEIAALKNEIASLKSVITQFQAMPQTFAGAHPGADYGINYDLSYMYSRLTQSGMAVELAADILSKAQQTIPAMKLKNRSIVDGWVARQILDNTRVIGGMGGGKVHCFMGPAGSGKTSMMVKLASHLVVREQKRVALLTTDTYKVGSADQLRIYAQILNVPFAVIRSQIDWNNITKYLEKVDVVLVDYTGFSLKNQDEIQSLRNVLPPSQLNPRVHLVLNAAIKDTDATEIGRRYGVFNYQDVVFTALDESTQHGTIYNFAKRFDVPISAFGIGTRVPEDFEFATKERMLDLLFKITNQQGQKTLGAEAV